jgi:leucyl aminopeptidase
MKRTYTKEPLVDSTSEMIIVPFVCGGNNFAVNEVRLSLSKQPGEKRLLAEYEGKALTHLKLEPKGTGRIIVVGLGPNPNIRTWREAIARGIKITVGQKYSTCSIYLDELREQHVAACIEGATLGAYRFHRYKSKPESSSLIHLKVGTVQKNPNHSAGSKMVKAASIRADAVTLCRDMVNEPANRLGVAELIEHAREIARRDNLRCKVISGAMLQKKGFHLIHAVGKAAETPPALIELEYTPARSGGKRIAIVGKGVVFDSGGLCLKPAASMQNMKTDMAGAAAVLSAMGALTALHVPHTVTAYIPVAENAIGSRSLRPGDVIQSYSGKTVEIVNTDAEGRLLLADALALASTRNHDEIVDLATLTGACAIALGKQRGAIFSDDPSLRQKWLEAADYAGELIWPLPLASELEREVTGDVADLKNSGDRFGGTILAALFLKKFVTRKTWVHFDIAGPARNGAATRLCPKGGTGFMVLTLLQYFQQA